MLQKLFRTAKDLRLNVKERWVHDTFKIVAIDPLKLGADITVHAFLSDIPYEARIAVSHLLTGKCCDRNSVFQSDIAVFDDKDKGDIKVGDYLVTYIDTGCDETSCLFSFIVADQSDITLATIL